MKKILIIISILTFLVGCNNPSDDKNIVNVYTDRHYEIDKQILEEFTNQTGIKVNVVELESAEVFAKLKAEKDSVADLVIMTGAEYIYKLNQQNILVNHEQYPNIDSDFYGQNWIGIVGRTRSVAISNDSDITITSYDDLANENLKGQILVRSSNNSYNQAWVASMIFENGEKQTRDWLQGFVKNFARTPQGNDRDQVKAVNGNEGDIAIVNSYYMNRMHTSSDKQEVEASNKVSLANLDKIHTNISFAALVDKNDASIKLLNYLQNPDVQTKISQENGEYPLNTQAKTNEYIANIQELNPQDINYEQFGMYIEKAYELMIEAGWE